jgi:hypothetical protein
VRFTQVKTLPTSLSFTIKTKRRENSDKSGGESQFGDKQRNMSKPWLKCNLGGRTFIQIFSCPNLIRTGHFLSKQKLV